MRQWPLLGCLLLSSCNFSLSHKEQCEHLLSTPSLEQSVDQALEAPFFQKGAWPDPKWWHIFASAPLNALIEEALSQNPSIQAMQARVEEAKQAAIIVESKLYPLIYFNGSDDWEHLSKNGLYRALNPNLALNNQQIDFGLSFTYEFDFWSKYRNQYRVALGIEKAREAEKAQVELVTTTALAQAYFALKTNQIRKQLYEELYQVRNSYFKLQERLVEHSLSSLLPPLLSQEEVLQAKQWLEQITQEIAVDEHLINVLAGKGPDEPIATEDELAPLPQKLVLPENLQAELLIRRPDLMAQSWKVESLAHEVGVARADYFPNVNLAAMAGFQSGSWSSLWQWVSGTLGLLPAFSLPVYTAGAIGANVGVKKALFDEAIDQYNDLILKSFQEVADLLAISKSVYAQKKDQDAIVQNASERYQLTLLRQQKGLDNAFAAYRFCEELLQKELQETLLLYEQYLVAIKLIKALGGGYLTPEEIPLRKEEVHATE